MNKQALLFCGTLFCGMCCVGAQANTEFITPLGSTINSQPVDASATFAISADTIVVTLDNMEANPKSVAQNLSDLSFTLGGGSSLGGASLMSSSGQEITVNSNHTFTLGPVVTPEWGFTQTGTSGALNVLGTPEAPKHTIIGPPGGGNLYSNADGSIAGNHPHNPFLDQTATFTITGSGITPSTTVTSATFSFNTEPGFTVVGTRVGVPEPATLGLLALGLLGAGFAGRKRRN